ncbi:30S ribosomal protein S7 [Halococcus saccharolyticus]|uniref:Small ribosomal subunit protein uS7 n=1 Tax=Halococcus saccharolyticus DSM 5350 TaxID=1227455 RepID=M0MCA1_9EURY|nr:30S ribosomal protein S7 [Halococcus saccharolyticus]EMA43376.1 30S ribosomal protein S7P [Halococcus saccharolyticus DSM 5350]
MSAEEDAPEPEKPAGTDEESETDAKLFERWEVTGFEYNDPSTKRYITVTPVEHTMGRHAGKQFQKSEVSIVERLINRLMQTDSNTGKKQQATRIVRKAFEEVHDRTDENPIQVLVTAVENAAPREETVRLKYGGISVPQAVDVAPQRRVDQALMFLAEGAYNASFKSPTDAHEALADQLTGAANYDVQTYAVNQKEEKERVAAAAR